MAMLAILILPLMYLGWTAVAVVLPSAVASMANAGPHGFSEVLYAFTSATANNGSAFGGLTGNTTFYNLTLGLLDAGWSLLHDRAGHGACRFACRKRSRFRLRQARSQPQALCSSDLLWV